MTNAERERELLMNIFDDLKRSRQVCEPEKGCGRCEEFTCTHTLGYYGVGSYRWHLHGKFLQWLKAKLKGGKKS